MECRDARDRFVDLLAGGLSEDDLQAVDEHLAACAECRAEIETLRAGEQALAPSVGLLAPAGRHLTKQRLRRLRTALHPHSDRSKILALQRVVASAAAAAILVSAIFIYQGVSAHLKRDDAAPADPGRPVAVGPGAARGERDPGPVMVGLASAPQVERLQMVSGYVGQEAPRSGARSEAGPQRADLVFAGSPGVRVPVSNRLYDAEEGAFWW